LPYQYGSYFRTTVVSALFRQYGSYFGFSLFLDNMAAILERPLFLLFLDNMTAISRNNRRSKIAAILSKKSRNPK
jgi:hypothetical protein